MTIAKHCRVAAVLCGWLWLAAPAQALIPPTSCGAPAAAAPDADSDLSVAYWARQPASMTMCAYGYWAEKCGDHATAHAIFDRCIDAGYAGAMIWKALLLEDGTGVAQDSAGAAALMRRAAESGDPEYAKLGKLHYATALYLGRGVARDPEAAMNWFRQAAADGDADAQRFLVDGTHTADRDRQGRSVAAQLAAQGGEGVLLQKAEPDAPPTDPSGGLLALLVALLIGGVVLRIVHSRPLRSAGASC
ncbi:MAG: sel1 repeat family protein [Rhodocyclaceae bacterium]|nr:sel1 repeat family protein [Rhodocyclaceae bacterium]